MGLWEETHNTRSPVCLSECLSVSWSWPAPAASTPLFHVSRTTSHGWSSSGYGGLGLSPSQCGPEVGAPFSNTHLTGNPLWAPPCLLFVFLLLSWSLRGEEGSSFPVSPSSAFLNTPGRSGRRTNWPCWRWARSSLIEERHRKEFHGRKTNGYELV